MNDEGDSIARKSNQLLITRYLVTTTWNLMPKLLSNRGADSIRYAGLLFLSEPANTDFGIMAGNKEWYWTLENIIKYTKGEDAARRRQTGIAFVCFST